MVASDGAKKAIAKYGLFRNINGKDESDINEVMLGLVIIDKYGRGAKFAAHGGIVYTLLHEIGWHAGRVCLRKQNGETSVRLQRSNIKYIKYAPLYSLLALKAYIVKCEKYQVVVKSVMLDDINTKRAEGTFVFDLCQDIKRIDSRL